MAIRSWIFLAAFFTSILAHSQSFSGDSLSSAACYFKNADGKTLTEGYFKNGQRHRIWTWYHTDGSIHYKCRYKYGRKLWIIYYDQGKVWMKINRYGRKRIIRKCDCQP